MRVKLSYTVEEEDVLQESSKILGLSAEDMQQCISLFQDVQKELQGLTTPETPPNISLALEMLGEFRKALLALDTRILEVTEIITGYEDYQRDSRRETSEKPSDDPYQDNFGGD